MFRRLFLAAPVLAAAAPAPPRLVVAGGAVLPLAACLFLPSGAVFSCPPGRARLVAVLRLRLMDITVIAFAADPLGGTQDLLAFVAPDGTLLALERHSWTSQNEDAFGTGCSMLPDRTNIALERHAARREQKWRREGWTDYLRMEQGGLVDAPVRTVLAGTWQSALARERQQCAAMLPAGQHGVPGRLLAILTTAAPPWSG